MRVFDLILFALGVLGILGFVGILLAGSTVLWAALFIQGWAYWGYTVPVWLGLVAGGIITIGTVARGVSE